jgi:hypothetical protein
MDPAAPTKPVADVSASQSQTSARPKRRVPVGLLTVATFIVLVLATLAITVYATAQSM